MKSSKPTAKKTFARPHNCYNVFFLLERERLLQSRPAYNPVTAAAAHSPVPDVAGYGYLEMPDFPTRYKGLVLPPGWYVPGRNRVRKHVKSHGCKFMNIVWCLACTLGTFAVCDKAFSILNLCRIHLCYVLLLLYSGYLS